MTKGNETPPRRTRTRSPGRFFTAIRHTIGGILSIPLRRSGVHLATLALALLTLSLLINFINQVIQSANLEARRAELEAEVAQIEQENNYIREGVAYAESDVHVERIAREQLGYAREGDTVILPQVTAPTPTPTPELEATPVVVPRPTVAPNWQRWWHTFIAPDDLPPAQ